MSRSQDPHPSRSFFPFGNPFRMISPKGSRMSPQLLAVLQAFEATLAERLKNLMPKSKDEILTLSWMTLAMKSLCESHNDIRTLMTALELPVSDWEDKWIDVYLDISSKLLDICNAFSSELSRLNQGNLPLKCALHNLDSASSKQYLRACSLLDDWRAWHQAAVAVGSVVGALLDPRRADLIAALGETTGKHAFERVLQRM
ncbi:Protein BPS1, chloroplastic [Glycine soja]|uniref:Protein BPS1, chloroplastic n=1 Tax=Glycine soja TaxID=3848 RepID=A0A0B2R3Y6_GLYSO|nr:Protein BPS1, chloroplastic [Glycine soja]